MQRWLRKSRHRYIVLLIYIYVFSLCRA